MCQKCVGIVKDSHLFLYPLLSRENQTNTFWPKQNDFFNVAIPDVDIKINQYLIKSAISFKEK